MSNYGNSFVESSKVRGNSLVFYVKSNESVAIYKVTISLTKLMANKKGRDSYMRYTYLCTCKSKKCNDSLFCKHLSYIMLLYFNKT